MGAGKTLSKEELSEYFDLIASKIGVKPYHRHFESAEIISDGLKIHLDIFEHHPKAPNILFIPGTALYAMCYAEIMYKLGMQGFNVIGIDPRGHGRSEGNRGDYTLMEVMKDVENTIEYIRNRYNDQVSLIGSSQGGILAFYLAAKDAKIQSAVCQNFADLTDPETLNLTRSPSITSFLKPIMLTMSGVIGEQSIPISTYLDLESIKVRHWGNAKNFIESDPLALQSITLRALRSLATTHLSRPIHQIKIPVMVFQGNKDSIFPVHYTEKIFNQLNCKKRIQIFDGLNHALITEDVDVVLPSIVQWLKEIYSEVKLEEDTPL